MIENPTVKRDLAVQCGNLVVETEQRPCWKKFILRIFGKEVVAARGKFRHVLRHGIWLPEGVGVL